MWIELTKERVIPRLSPQESSAIMNFDATHHAAGQDLLQEIIDAVTAEIRAAIAQCEKNRLHRNSSRIPMAQLNDAIALISYNVGTRVGIPITDSRDPRYNVYARAQEHLDKLRTCEILAENPDTGEVPTNGSTGAQLVFTTPSRMDRKRWNF